jgi:hypothetical protein
LLQRRSPGEAGLAQRWLETADLAPEAAGDGAGGRGGGDGTEEVSEGRVEVGAGGRRVAGEAARYPSVGAAVGGGGGSEGGWTEEDEPREEDKGAMRVRWFTRLCLRVHAVYQGGGRGGGSRPNAMGRALSP